MAAIEPPQMCIIFIFSCSFMCIFQYMPAKLPDYALICEKAEKRPFFKKAVKLMLGITTETGKDSFFHHMLFKPFKRVTSKV
jgi:hypothetical protein